MNYHMIGVIVHQTYIHWRGTTKGACTTAFAITHIYTHAVIIDISTILSLPKHEIPQHKIQYLQLVTQTAITK